VSNRDPRVVSDIAEYGWHGVHVADSIDPHVWSYSIGLLETWKHPELILFGLPFETAHQVIWDAIYDIERGVRFGPLDRWEVFKNGYEATFLPVDPRWLEFMGQALRHYDDDVGALQCAWPDRERRMPWEAGYDDAAQPLLISDELAAQLGVAVDEAYLGEVLGPES
jgi:Domain of unknown function (DUF4262)